MASTRLGSPRPTGFPKCRKARARVTGTPHAMGKHSSRVTENLMIKYSDIYVSTLARGLCNPGEQVIGAGAGTYQSFWSFGIPFFRHSYLVIATSERVIVVDHRKGLIFDRMDAVNSYRWADIGTLELGGLLTKKLVLKDAASRPLLTMKLPRVHPIPKNVAALRKVVHTWEQRRSLGAATHAYGALPAPGIA
jgi:hypothetical protein